MKKNKNNPVLFILLLIMMPGIANADTGIRTEENAAPKLNFIIDVPYKDLESLLLPRIRLVATTNARPFKVHRKGMIVYNTVTKNDVLPGVYYNDGTKWVAYSIHSNYANCYPVRFPQNTFFKITVFKGYFICIGVFLICFLIALFYILKYLRKY